MRIIDADALMDELSTMYKQPKSTEDFMAVGYDHAIADTVITVHKQPTIKERKTGHWIRIRTEEDGNTYYECSVCHKGVCYVPIIVEVPYCWNCGAKMEVKNDV